MRGETEDECGQPSAQHALVSNSRWFDVEVSLTGTHLVIRALHARSANRLRQSILRGLDNLYFSCLNWGERVGNSFCRPAEGQFFWDVLFSDQRVDVLRSFAKQSHLCFLPGPLMLAAVLSKWISRGWI